MAYSFSTFGQRAKEANEWLARELAGIRTSRATPVLLDGVSVEAYGSRVPLSKVASIGVEDARTLRVTPYDEAIAKDIEKAITVANLGLSVGLDERGVRVAFPELTAERRDSLVRSLRDKLETARISVRKARDDAWDDIQKKEQGGSMSEDEKFRAKKELEKMTEAANKTLADAAARKEKELHG